MENQPQFYLCVKDNPAGGMTYTGHIRSGVAHPELKKNKWFRPITFTPKIEIELGHLQHFEFLSFNGTCRCPGGIIFPENEPLRVLYYLPYCDIFVGLTMELGAGAAKAKRIDRNMAMTLFRDLAYKIHAFPREPEIGGMRALSEGESLEVDMRSAAEASQKARKECVRHPLDYSPGRARGL